jgi:alcohol dehydrogenase
LNTFNFKLNTNLVFGPNSLDSVVDYVKENDCKKIAVIIDRNVGLSDHWQSIKAKLEQHCEFDPYFENDLMEPTYDYLDEIRGQFSNDVDALIGVGGGSTLDISKAISVLVANEKPALEYRGFGFIEKPGVPLILATSTAGSGSEITPYSVFIETESKQKFGINSPLITPILSIVDPLLTVSCPRSVTLASGMDAITHTIEAFSSKKNSTMVRLFAQEAFSLIFNNLPKLLDDLSNVDLRTKLSLGAHYAGIALFNSSGSAAGVLSYPIGTLYGVTHGMAGAPFLRPVIEHNVANGYQDYGLLYDTIDPENRVTDGTGNKNELFAQEFAAFADRLDIPRNLGTFGAKKSDIPTIIQHLQILWPAIEQNPVDLAQKDVESILLGLLD